MLNSVLALKSLVLLNVIGFVVLLAVWFRKRFFCRFLCPMGCVLDRIPKHIARSRSSEIKKVPAIGKWLAVISLTGAVFGFPVFIFLDPVSIFNGFFVSLIQPFGAFTIVSLAGLLLLLLLTIFWPGLWCKRLCPLGGLQRLISDLKGLVSSAKPATEKLDMGRRIFIGCAVGSAAAIAFPFVAKGEDDKIIRPPASLDQEDFYALCTRCGSCLKACPTDILRQDVRWGLGFLTPVVKFEKGYCLETCNACSVVCPSGAITLFDIGAKSQLTMGKAAINTSDCLLLHQTECDCCKKACSYQALNIRGQNENQLMMPEVDLAKCVGCGACKVICPKNCITIS